MMSLDPSRAWQTMQDDRLVVIVLPIFFVAIVVEALWAQWTRREIYRRSDFIASIWMLFAAITIELGPKVLQLALMYELYEWSPLRDVVGRQPWAWALLFVLDDFTYYWFHRLNHEVRLCWTGHVNHHSSKHMNLGTALRQGPGERVYKLFLWCWLAALGFDPAMILTMIGLNLTYQFWVHTEAVRRMPAWFEAIFNTPSHHRVHHASNVRYLDRNHGGVLIVWDRLFGTFSPELDEEPVRYGLTRDLVSDHPWNVFFQAYRELAADWRRAGTWRARLGYLLHAPGWRHDGPDHRSDTLRAEAGL
jgi:sterol desaturase/sphingolipid hydroxylase (fatty acid hydroxylase superfamily)